MDTPGLALALGAETAAPIRHVPLQNAVCVLCGSPIWLNDKIAAVVGCCEAPSHSGYTFAFSFPRTQPVVESVTVHEKDCSSQWRLCRSQSCGHCRKVQDAALYHVDCFQMIARHHKRLRFRDIWTMSTWSQPFPKARYHSWPSCSTAGFSNLDPKPDNLSSSIARLPEELRENIFRQCSRGLYKQLLTALHRRGLFSSLLDENHVENEYPFTKVLSWSRRTEVVRDDHKHRWVHIQLDDLGIARLEVLDKRPRDSPRCRHLDKGFMVENLSRLQNSRIKIKGRFLRISTSEPLHIWDTPHPPTTNVSWYKKTTPHPIFVQPFLIEDLSGITAFCHDGLVHSIHPHYIGDPDTDAPLPNQEDFHPLERLEYTPVFYPIAPEEHLDSFWVRYRDVGGHRTDIALVLVTNFCRTLVIGNYKHPSQAGVTFAPVQLNIGRYLLLPRLDPTLTDQNFALTKPATRDVPNSMVIPNHLARALFPPLEIDTMLYLSVAPFVSITKMRFFYKPVPGKKRRKYTGVMIHYTDGACESLGSCYGQSHSELVSEPTQISVFHEEAHMNLGFSPSASWNVQIQDQPQSHEIQLGDTMLWWFDDGGICMVESQTRAQVVQQ